LDGTISLFLSKRISILWSIGEYKSSCIDLIFVC
jgi:hypothetical protein